MCFIFSWRWDILDNYYFRLHFCDTRRWWAAKTRSSTAYYDNIVRLSSRHFEASKSHTSHQPQHHYDEQSNVSLLFGCFQLKRLIRWKTQASNSTDIDQPTKATLRRRHLPSCCKKMARPIMRRWSCIFLVVAFFELGGSKSLLANLSSRALWSCSHRYHRHNFLLWRKRLTLKIALFLE